MSRSAIVSNAGIRLVIRPALCTLTEPPKKKRKAKEKKNKTHIKKSNESSEFLIPPANHNARLPFAATCRWKRPPVRRSLPPRANETWGGWVPRVLLAGPFASVRGVAFPVSIRRRCQRTGHPRRTGECSRSGTLLVSVLPIPLAIYYWACTYLCRSTACTFEFDTRRSSASVQE